DLKWGCRWMTRAGKPQEDFVSVIVPMRNTRQYVRESLESILNQTHSNLEIIVADDDSDDCGIDIVNEVLEKDFRRHWTFYVNYHNGAAARRDAIKLAVGDYVCCFDADAVMQPN